MVLKPNFNAWNDSWREGFTYLSKTDETKPLSDQKPSNAKSKESEPDDGYARTMTEYDAAKILGRDQIISDEELKRVFGEEWLATHDVPGIPYTPEELEFAKMYNMALIYRTSCDIEGRPLTPANMLARINDRLRAEGRDTISVPASYKKLPYFTNGTPKTGWALSALRPMPDFNFRDFFTQTKRLGAFAAETCDGDLMAGASSEELEAYRAGFDLGRGRITSGAQAREYNGTIHKLMSLPVNQQCRGSVADAVYDALMILYTHGTNIYLIEEPRSTNILTKHNKIVGVHISSDWSLELTEHGPHDLNTSLYPVLQKNVKVPVI